MHVLGPQLDEGVRLLGAGAVRGGQGAVGVRGSSSDVAAVGRGHGTDDVAGVGGSERIS